MTSNSVFIASSIDGFIADRNGGIDWLHALPNPEMDDMGYASFMEEIDALIMGRITFETICSFDMEWPYSKPVFVLSNSLPSIPPEYANSVFLVKGTLRDVLSRIHAKGYTRLYIDGGTTIQQFLKEDLIDRLILTTIPILLGEGAPLFGKLPVELTFDLVESKTFLNHVVQRHYTRRRY